MSEVEQKPCVSDKVLGELALKVEAELPDELRRFVTFRQDVGAKNLIVDSSVDLPEGDLKFLSDVVVAYGGSFLNLKVGGKDHGCFMIPKKQPPPAVPPAVEEKKPDPQAKLDQPLKQPSPLVIHQDKYCSSCSEQATCNPRTVEGRARLVLCFEVVKLNYLDFLCERLHKIAKLLEDAPRVPAAEPILPPTTSAPVSKPPTFQPQTVPRDTRPVQGHVDMGIVWTNESGSNGAYEKATEKDNKDREDYFRLDDEIGAQGRIFKDGFSYWRFDQGPAAIGRKRTQPQRGRR